MGTAPFCRCDRTEKTDDQELKKDSNSGRKIEPANFDRTDEVIQKLNINFTVDAFQINDPICNTNENNLVTPSRATNLRPKVESKLEDNTNANTIDVFITENNPNTGPDISNKNNIEANVFNYSNSSDKSGTENEINRIPTSQGTNKVIKRNVNMHYNILGYGNRIPLEVINENYNEASKDSIGDCKSYKLLKSNSSSSYAHDTDKRDIMTSIKSFPKIEEIIEEIGTLGDEIKTSEAFSTRNSPRTNSDKANSKPNIKEKNYNGKVEEVSDYNNQCENASPVSKESPKKKLLNDKEKEKNKSLQLKQLITKIIPENKLIKCDYDDILFQSELKKLINNEISTSSSQLYSTRFCLITKNEFRYYKSKEQFLNCQKPLYAIPFFCIKGVNFINYNSKKFDHLLIEVAENYKSVDQIRKSPLLNKDKKSHSRHKSNDVNLDFPKLNDSPMSKFKRISLIDQSNMNDQTKEPKENTSQNSGDLIFTSDKEELLNKWGVVLNYFINE